MLSLTSKGSERFKKVYTRIPLFVNESDRRNDYLSMFRLHHYRMLENKIKAFSLCYDSLVSSQITYFQNTHWDYYLMYRLCCYYTNFRDVNTNVTQNTDVYNQFVKINKQIKNWKSDRITNFLKWLGETPHYINSTRELLHIQFVDTLQNYSSKGPTTKTLLSRDWIKKQKYLMLDHNILIDSSKLYMVRYKNESLYVCSQNISTLSFCENILGFVNKDVYNYIDNSFVNRSYKDRFYIDVFDGSEVSQYKSKNYNHVDSKYFICGQDHKLFSNYIKILRKNRSVYDKCRNRIMYKIENSRDYVNLDNLRIEKNPNKPYKNSLYKICSTNKELLDYYVSILKSLKEPENIPTKKKRRAIPSKIRMSVWRKAFKGSMDGNCFSCGDSINIECWDCGHIVSHADGGDMSLNNLVPLCSSCNRSMGRQNLYEWMKEYKMYGVKNIPT